MALFLRDAFLDSSPGAGAGDEGRRSVGKVPDNARLERLVLLSSNTPATTASAMRLASGSAAGVGPGDTTDGGRILNVTGIGAHVSQARTRAYAAVGMISWPGMHYR